MFDKKLKEFLLNANFIQTWLIKFIWNLSGRKMLVLITVIVFFIFRRIDQWALLAGIGIFAGSNVVEKFRGNYEV